MICVRNTVEHLQQWWSYLSYIREEIEHAEGISEKFDIHLFCHEFLHSSSQLYSCKESVIIFFFFALLRVEVYLLLFDVNVQPFIFFILDILLKLVISNF